MALITIRPTLKKCVGFGISKSYVTNANDRTTRRAVVYNNKQKGGHIG